ncbi:MAG TPA: TadE family protein [Candidatus Acidoferrales bacterium]|nr:TadE family protein [Candidatus Acidoferrales bacterium]
MTEFALVLPIAVLILGLAATGGQMLVSAIDLTQAARAAVIQDQADYNGNNPAAQLGDAQTAAAAEMGIHSLACNANGSSIPLGCAAVVDYPDPKSGQHLVEVRLWQSITPFIPIIPSITVSAQATEAS